MPIERVIRKFKLGEQPGSADAWKAYSYEDRIAALESIRREYHNYRYGAEPRLQRVLVVTQQA